MGASVSILASEIDAELHSNRIDTGMNRLTHQDDLDSLPDGCFVEIGGNAYLVRGDELLLWTPEGYVTRDARPSGPRVTVLTPRPTVECLRSGYLPEIHDSAGRR